MIAPPVVYCNLNSLGRNAVLTEVVVLYGLSLCVVSPERCVGDCDDCCEGESCDDGCGDDGDHLYRPLCVFVVVRRIFCDDSTCDI